MNFPAKTKIVRRHGKKSVPSGFPLGSYDGVCNVQKISLRVRLGSGSVLVYFLGYFCACLCSSVFGSPEHKSYRSTGWHKFIKLLRLGAII